MFLHIVPSRPPVTKRLYHTFYDFYILKYYLGILFIGNGRTIGRLDPVVLFFSILNVNLKCRDHCYSLEETLLGDDTILELTI